MGNPESRPGSSRVWPPVYLLGAAVVLLAIAVIVLLYMQFQGNVVATVNGEKIYKDELFEALNRQAGSSTLEQLIIQRLIAQEARSLGLQVSQEEVDGELDRFIETALGGDKEKFKQFLDQYNISEDTLRWEIELDLLLRKIVEETMLDIQEKDIQEYFEKNRDDFNIPEQVEARHILVETEEEAREILAQLRNGGDFVELAKKHSLDEASLENDANLGFFTREDMVEEFSNAAFDLEVGQLSEPVKTVYGYHIIEVLNRREAREVELEEVYDQVREVLKESQIMEKREELIQDLYEKAEIRNYLT